MKKRFLFFFSSFFIVFIAGTTAHALLLSPLNLAELTQLSDRVFVGTCLSVQKVTDEQGLSVEYVTFQVNEMLKGPWEDSITFKQIAPALKIEELPTYREGEVAVLFLAAPHPETGLSAPMGLSQGKFEVRGREDGAEEVINGVGNQGLLTGLNGDSSLKALVAPRPSAGPILYDDFVSVVKGLAH